MIKQVNISIQILVDTDSDECKQWDKESEFIESEIEEVLGTFTSISNYGRLKSAERQQTKDGSRYDIVITQRKRK